MQVDRRILNAVATPKAASSVFSPQHRAERFVASARLVFTLCGLLAITIDPSEPARNAPLVYGLVGGYAVYSLIALWWATSSADAPAERILLLTHTVDVAVLVLIGSLSGGATSPFFSFLTFPLLSASLRWGWRGAAWTGAASLCAFSTVALSAALSQHADIELNAVIIRAAYLIIVTLMLAYVGAHDQRVRREMEMLASWRNPAVATADRLVTDLLRHITSLVEAPRVLLVWQAADQQWRHVAHRTGTEIHTSEDVGMDFGPLVAEPLADGDFLCRDAAAADAEVLCVTHGRSWRWRGEPLAPALRSAFSIGAVISVDLRREFLLGRLFVLDKPGATSDDLVLATIVGSQVADALEQQYRTRRLRAAAISEERGRIARDVHDGALQSLAGVALRLETIRCQMEVNAPAARAALQELQSLVLLQQRELRTLVRTLQTGSADADAALADLLTELVLRVEQEWRLRVKLDIDLPPGGFHETMSEDVANEIPQLLREALINVARHTMALEAHIAIVHDGDALRVTVSDEGQGFAFEGRMEHAELAERNVGPVMLRQRIAALGGSLAIESSKSGARLEIILPPRRPR
jgi:signal transduction histidine kinase